MKLHVQAHLTEEKHLDQDKVKDLKEDLLTVLESHASEFKVGDLFYQVIKYVTYSLYVNACNHGMAGDILNESVNDGINQYVNTNEEK